MIIHNFDIDTFPPLILNCIFWSAHCLYVKIMNSLVIPLACFLIIVNSAGNAMRCQDLETSSTHKTKFAPSNKVQTAKISNLFL